MGFPVPELSKDIQEAEPNDFNRRDRPGDEDRPPAEFTGTTGTFDVSGETGDSSVQGSSRRRWLAPCDVDARSGLRPQVRLRPAPEADSEPVPRALT